MSLVLDFILPIAIFIEKNADIVLLCIAIKVFGLLFASPLLVSRGVRGLQ